MQRPLTICRFVDACYCRCMPNNIAHLAICTSDTGEWGGGDCMALISHIYTHGYCTAPLIIKSTMMVKLFDKKTTKMRGCGYIWARSVIYRLNPVQNNSTDPGIQMFHVVFIVWKSKKHLLCIHRKGYVNLVSTFTQQLSVSGWCIWLHISGWTTL